MYVLDSSNFNFDVRTFYYSNLLKRLVYYLNGYVIFGLPDGCMNVVYTLPLDVIITPFEWLALINCSNDFFAFK